MSSRPPCTGMVRPYRQLPDDFREKFVELGWAGIAAHYRAHDRTIARWIEEAGGEELRAERSTFAGVPRFPSRRSKRYVLGRTLTPMSERARPDSGATSGHDQFEGDENG